MIKCIRRVIMAEQTGRMMTRNCDFCPRSFQGVDTKRSYRRHLREKHPELGAEQVRRVVVLSHSEVTGGDDNRGPLPACLPSAVSSALPRVAAEDHCFPEVVVNWGSTLRSLEPPDQTSIDESAAQCRFLEELMTVEAPGSHPALPLPSSPAGDGELQDIFGFLLATETAAPTAFPGPSPSPEEELPFGPLNLVMAKDPERPDERNLTAPPMNEEENLAQVVADRASPPAPPPARLPVDAPTLSDLAPVLAWANRLFPPYDYGQFLADAKRLFPLCSVKMATEVYVNCRLAHERPGHALAPFPPVVVISSDSEPDIPDEDDWSTHGASPVSIAENPDSEEPSVGDPGDDDPNDDDYIQPNSEEGEDSVSSSVDDDEDSSPSAEASSSSSEEEVMSISSEASEY